MPLINIAIDVQSSHRFVSCLLVNVYFSQGQMNDGLEVAVKRCSLSGSQSDPEKLSQEFRTEVELLMNINHRNVVKLIGYCTERREMISVYEYMPNGSLDKYIYGMLIFINISITIIRFGQATVYMYCRICILQIVNDLPFLSILQA